MRTILVPTDFSAAAAHAAHYALQLAKSLHTGIELCHAFSVPLEAPGAQVAWPLEDYTSLKEKVTAELSLLSGKMEQEERAGSNPQSYRPQVSYSSEVGTVIDMTRNIVAGRQLNLVAMGMSGAGGLRRFFLGSQSRDLIEAATFPVLLIPLAATCVPVRKIAFATDLEPENIEVLHALAGLARLLNAEILITHCTDEKQEPHSQSWQVTEFLADVSAKADYSKIYYRHVKSVDVERGLDWLSEHGQVDILAMVHHQRHFLNKLLTGSHTQAMAGHIRIPLLVFPPGYCAAF